MFSRRTLLAALGLLLWWGCTKTPELPLATAFLQDLQLLDRDRGQKEVGGVHAIGPSRNMFIGIAETNLPQLGHNMGVQQEH